MTEKEVNRTVFIIAAAIMLFAIVADKAPNYPAAVAFVSSIAALWQTTEKKTEDAISAKVSELEKELSKLRDKMSAIHLGNALKK